MKHIASDSKIYMQYRDESAKFCTGVFDEQLRMKNKFPAEGRLRAVIADKFLIYDNCEDPDRKTKGQHLTIRDVKTHGIIHRLSPPGGAYPHDKELYVCGMEDGRVAVVVQDKKVLDIYDENGEIFDMELHLVRSWNL